MITPFKAILLLFILFAWTRVVLRYRERIFGSLGLVAWTIIWFFAGYFVLIPGKSDIVAQYLGVSKGTDAVFSLAIIIMAYLIYRIYVLISYQQKTITKLTRELALSNFRRKKIDK